MLGVWIRDCILANTQNPRFDNAVTCIGEGLDFQIGFLPLMDEANIFVLDIDFDFNFAPLRNNAQNLLAGLQDLPQTRDTHRLHNAMTRTA